MLVCRGNLTTFVFMIKQAACQAKLCMQSWASHSILLVVVVYLCLILKTSNVFMELMFLNFSQVVFWVDLHVTTLAFKRVDTSFRLAVLISLLKNLLMNFKILLVAFDRLRYHTGLSV